MAKTLNYSVLWNRQGIGPELSVPHALFEVLTEGFERWSPDPTKMTKLISLLRLDPTEKQTDDLALSDPCLVFGTLSILLQRRAGYSVEQCSVRRKHHETYTVAVEQIWHPAAKMAAELAAQFLVIIGGELNATDHEIVGAVIRYEKLCHDGPSVDHRYLHREAVKRGIPARLKPPSGLVLGHGRRRRQLFRMITERTSHLAFRLASNETNTLHSLRSSGIPVPEHRQVMDVSEARTIATQIGYPVVVKPVNTDRDEDITVGITSHAELERAFHLARSLDAQVAVEGFIPGDTYRFLVVGGKCVSVARTRPTVLVGDGKSTIRQLVNKVNSSPLRGPGRQKPPTTLDIDDEALTIPNSHNLTPESVLPFAKALRLRTTSSLSRGGESISVNEVAHQDNVKLAERCAQVIGLDIAGVDYRTDQIEKSWRDSKGGITRVTPSPGLRMHIEPAAGRSTDIASSIFDLLFDGSADYRIPIIAVTGTNGKTTTTRMITQMIAASGLVVGSTTTNEVTIADSVVQRGDSAGPFGARRVLDAPEVEFAVLETARGGLLKYGLAFERSDVAVVTNVESDHIGELGVECIEELAAVKMLVARTADTVVLNADNQHCMAMTRLLDGKKFVLFSMDSENPNIVAHTERDGVAYVLSMIDGEEFIVRKAGENRATVTSVRDLPMTFAGAARHNIQNAMAAFAAVDSLQIDQERALAAARNFYPESTSNIGRLSKIDGFPFEIFVDFAHNKHGFSAISEFVTNYNTKGRKICVVTMNGARNPDPIVVDAMEPLAKSFDLFLVHNLDTPDRHRAGMPEALRSGLISAGVDENSVIMVDGQKAAVLESLKLCTPGDMLMVLGAYDPEMIIATVETFKGAVSPNPS